MLLTIGEAEPNVLFKIGGAPTNESTHCILPTTEPVNPIVGAIPFAQMVALPAVIVAVPADDI